MAAFTELRAVNEMLLKKEMGEVVISCFCMSCAVLLYL